MMTKDTCNRPQIVETYSFVVVVIVVDILPHPSHILLCPSPPSSL